MIQSNNDPRVARQRFDQFGPPGPVFVRTRCPDCHADIVYAMNRATGARIPMNASSMGLYAVRVSNGQTICIPANEYPKLHGDADVQVMTNHLLTCAKRTNKHSQTL